MEGDGVTDPDFLDDPQKLFRGSRGSIRLDDPEKLFQEQNESCLTGNWRRTGDGCFVRTISWKDLGKDSPGPISFDPYEAKPLLRLDPTPWVSDLVVHRWRRASFSPDEEIDAVRRIQSADICGPLRPGFRGFDDFARLLAGFQRKILQIANGHMPKRWRRRMAFRDKHVNNLFFEDLVAAGVAAMWKAALKFDLESGYRFWTGVRAPVLGAISDEARIWRRHGSRETRLDRWLYAHPEASPEQVLRAQERLVKRPVFHSLHEAAEGIRLFWAWGSEFDYSIETDETFEIATGAFFAGMYSCFSRYTLSPHLRYHEPFSFLVDRLSGGLDTGPDVGNASRPKVPREPLDCAETAVVQFKNGKRQVTRQRAASYCYGIVVTPELRARATDNLEFAERRWESRIKRAPLPAQTYPRWSTKFGVGRAEHENKQIVLAYVPVTRFKWEVEYRRAERNVLQVLESPSRHCLKTRPCEICSRSHMNNVPRLSVSLSAA